MGTFVGAFRRQCNAIYDYFDSDAIIGNKVTGQTIDPQYYVTDSHSYNI